MASFVYNKAKTLLAKGDRDFDVNNVWALLVMSNTTADTEDDVENIGDIVGSLDEYDGASYARTTVVPGRAVNEDLPNNRVEFDATDIEFGNLGVGTRQCVGLVLYEDANNDGLSADDATNKLIAYIELTPFDGNGTDVLVGWNAEGILQLS